MTNYQPDFSRFRRALLLEGEPDRVPQYDTVQTGVMSKWLGKPVHDLETTVEFYAKAGYDFITTPAAVDLWSALQRGKLGAPYGKGAKEQFSLYAAEPEERVWAREGKGVITTMKEFEEFHWPGLKDMDFSFHDRLETLLPHGMKVIPSVGHIFTLIWNLMGLETFSLATADEPELVAAMFKIVGDTQLEVLDKVTKYKSVGAIFLADDVAYTSGLMISPRLLRRYLFPIYERMCAMCRERDIPIIYHSDGNVESVLDDIVAIGFNGYNPIQPNAMDIKKVKEKYGKKLCLIGNIDLDVLSRGTPEQVVALTKKTLREIAPGGGFCCGSSNSIANFVPVENYNAMREAVLKYGTYPIRI